MAKEEKTKKEKEADEPKGKVEEMCENLPVEMRGWREKRKMTQKQMAAAIGKQQGEISRYEKGGVKVPVDVVLNYSDVLRVSLDDLFGESVEVAIDESDILAEYRKLSARMQYYLYQMLKEMNRR